MRLKDLVGLLKDTFKEWNEDGASRLGAAVAYYTIFSLAPLLIIIIAMAGLFFGQRAVQGQVVGQIEGLIGHDGAVMVQSMIANSNKPSANVIATVIGIVTLLLGATGLFGELQSSLNLIWEVAPKPRGVFTIVKDRLLSFSMILGIGFLLLVSLVLSAAIAAAGQFVGSAVPVPEIVLHAVNFVISFLIITGLFAMMYKVLPDAEISWRDVLVGAAVTSLLFTVGKLLIGLYLGHSGTTSTYGTAGALVVILLWVYYSAQILFFGAEFTQIYSNRYGSKVKPAPDATSLRDQLRGKDLQPDTEHAGQSSTAQQPAGVSADQKPTSNNGRSSGRASQPEQAAPRSERRPSSPPNQAASVGIMPTGPAPATNHPPSERRPSLASLAVAGGIAVALGLFRYVRGPRSESGAGLS